MLLKRFRLYASTVLAFIVLCSTICAQTTACNISPNGWGYNLDSLKTEVLYWSTRPGITLDTLGYSAQNRPIYRLIIQTSDQAVDTSKMTTITFHARTHPREVQSAWTVREMLKYLQTTAGQSILQKHKIYILPSLNPDGVALGCERVNADGIDLEAAWKRSPLPSELVALKKHFDEIRATTHRPIVAINLHSSVNLCTRYFVYHPATSTSAKYASMEQAYIQSVQKYFVDGIENFSFYTGWLSGDPGVYPESYWWSTEKENTMALTYEDSNCPNAGNYNITAEALLNGSSEWLSNDPLNSISKYHAHMQNKIQHITFDRNGTGKIIFDNRYDIKGQNPK